MLAGHINLRIKKQVYTLARAVQDSQRANVSGRGNRGEKHRPPNSIYLVHQHYSFRWVPAPGAFGC